MKNKILTIAIIILITISAILILNNQSNREKGDLKEITYKEITKKQKNQEDFILIVSKSTCSHCLTYKPKVKQIAKENNITVYYIDYDKLSNQAEFLKNLNLSGATPITLFFKNGKEKSVLNRIDGDLSTDTVIEKFKKMGFID